MQQFCVGSQRRLGFCVLLLLLFAGIQVGKLQWFKQQLIELKPGELPNNVLPVDVFPELFGLDVAVEADKAIFKLTDATIYTNSTAGGAVKHFQHLSDASAAPNFAVTL